MEEAEARFAQQLKKGVLEMLVLALLAERPGHGYELLLRLRERSGGLLQLREGTLYPLLYRLEDGGSIVAAWQPVRGGERAMPRKVYTITAAGRTALTAQVAIWRQFSGCVEHFVEEAANDE